MNSEILERVILPAILLIALGIFYLLGPKRYYGKFFSGSRILQYLLWFCSFGVASNVLKGFAILSNSSTILLGCDICWILHIYCFSCWVKLNLEPFLNPSKTQTLVFFQPKITIVLGLICLAQVFWIILTPLTAQHFLLSDLYLIRLSYFWAWLAGFAILGFGLICLINCLIKAVRGVIQYRGIMRAQATYRFYSILYLSLLQFLVYLPDFLGHLIYPIWGLSTTTRAALSFSSPMELLLIPSFALMLPLDKKLVQVTNYLKQKQAQLYLSKLQWFYQFATIRYPARFLYDPYEFVGLRQPSEVLEDLIDILNEIRIWVLQSEVALGNQLGQSLSVKQEAYIWAQHLVDPKELIISSAINIGGVDKPKLSHYYVALAKAVRSHSNIQVISWSTKDEMKSLKLK